MHKELSYLTPEGHTVFTSQFLKNRGTCCKSACLHCPFGYTLKKHGLTFLEVSESDSTLVEEIMSESGDVPQDWKTFLPGNALFIQIKGVTAGVLLKNHIVVKRLYLKDHFKHQDLSREMVESYLFI